MLRISEGNENQSKLNLNIRRPVDRRAGNGFGLKSATTVGDELVGATTSERPHCDKPK